MCPSLQAPARGDFNLEIFSNNLNWPPHSIGLLFRSCSLSHQQKGFAFWKDKLIRNGLRVLQYLKSDCIFLPLQDNCNARCLLAPQLQCYKCPRKWLTELLVVKKSPEASIRLNSKWMKTAMYKCSIEGPANSLRYLSLKP